MKKQRKYWLAFILICSEILVQAQLCKVPFSITFYERTTTSIKLTWSDTNMSPEGWEIEVVERGMPRTFTPTYPLIPKKEFTITGLKPSTAYELYIRSVCSQVEKSLWNVAIPFVTVLDIPTACPLSVPLKDNGTETLFLDVPQDGILGKNVFLQQVDLIIEHDWPADLKIILESPQGQQLALVNHKGNNSGNFGNAIDSTCQQTCSFSPQACNEIKNFRPPFIGLFRTEGNIASWQPDTLAKGYWKLIIQDRALKDIGTLKYLNLLFKTENCSVPEQFKATRIDDSSVTVSWAGAANCNTVRLTATSGNMGDTLFVNCKTGSYRFNNLKPGLPYCFTITSVCSFSSQSLASCCLNATTTCNRTTSVEDFESQSTCKEGCAENCNIQNSIWHNPKSDGVQDWIVWSGQTDTENTGPSGGQANSQNYIYIENNPSICSAGEKVYLQSTCMEVVSNPDSCDMEFYYHMFGSDVTFLNLEISTDNGESWQLIHSIQGNQGDSWQRAKVSLNPYNGILGQFRFYAQTANGPLGDIGLDRISFLGSKPLSSLQTYFADNDGDGYGTDNNQIQICSSIVPAGYSPLSGDCNDDNSSIHPGADEIPCNGIDENCNGLADDKDLVMPIVVTANSKNASCNGSMDGAISLLVSGGQPPYNIEWNNNTRGDSLTGISAGIYHATITDAMGCITNTPFYVVKADNTINAIVSAIRDPNCRGVEDGSIQIAHSENAPPYSYNWSQGSTEKNISNIGTGSYSVTITDGNNCSISLENIQLSAASGVQATIKQIKQPLCAPDSTGQVEIIASGGTPPYLFRWNTGATEPLLRQLAANQYVCTVTDSKGCFDEVVVNITSPPQIVPKVISTENVRCFGEKDGSIKTEVSGGTPPYTFLWSHFALTDDVFGLKSGNYTLTVTDSRGCNAVTAPIAILQPAPFILTLDSIHPSTCLAGNNGFISILAEGGNGEYIYSWSHTRESSPSFSNLDAGNYSITAFDKLGCKASIPNIELTYVNKPIEVDVFIQKVNACAQDEVGQVGLFISNGTAPFNCNWSHGFVQVLSSGTDTLEKLASGNYRVTVTDADGCTGTSPDINIPERTIIQFDIENIILNECAGDSTGMIQIDITGGVSPYSVSWNDGLYTGQTLANLSDGTYQGEISDAVGCKTSIPTVLLEAKSDIKSNEVITDDIDKAAEGSICLFPSGGNVPYRFQWEGSTSVENCLNDLPGGVYIATITDNTSCSKVFQFEVADLSNTEEFETSDNSVLKVYPNPAANEIMIHPRFEGAYCMLNQQGIIVKCGHHKSDGIPVNDLVGGIYTLILEKGEKKVKLRFIKL